MDTPNPRPVNCLHCVHFAVTWDPRFPRLCKLYGFKTSDYPSAAVVRATGTPCQGFVRKEKHEV